eukprot:gene7482-15319_t
MVASTRKNRSYNSSLLGVLALHGVLSFRSLCSAMQGLNTPRRVAICGAGISGAISASTLAKAGCLVTIFERGRSSGGRASSRRHDVFGFDHGASYIEPKSDEFTTIINEFVKDGVMKPWNGAFGKLSYSTTNTHTQSSLPHQSRYVGYPTMSSITRHLLENPNIKKEYQFDAIFRKSDKNNKWIVYKGNEEEMYDEFDWVVSTDRAAGHLDQIPSSIDNLINFRTHIRNIKTSPRIVLMVAFAQTLALPYDHIDVTGHAIISRLVRDSNKPGRERTDGMECWVVQSTPAIAERIISDVAARGGDKMEVAAIAEKELLQALASLTKDMNCVLPDPIFARGHRWGGAFPIPSRTLAEDLGPCCLSISNGSAFVDRNNNFGACGDYFIEHGSIEGATLSSVAMAREIIRSESVL